MTYKTRVFTGVLPKSLLRKIQDDADHLAECPNYWIPRDIVESGGTSPAEKISSLLLSLVADDLPPDDWAGVEYWVQVYDQGRGLAFHFDKDEHAMKENQLMVNPILSSVLYLTGDITNNQIQAPTVVTNQAFDHDIGEPVPENPTSSTFVFPQTNSYCVFDGCLGHGVLDCGDDSQRATLLINWWKEKPQNIEEKTTGVTITGGAVDIKDNGDNDSNIQCDNDDNEEDTDAPLCECIYPVEVDIAPQATESKDDDEDAFILVDDVLKDHGIAITGSDAVQAVTIHHEGMMLYPVDSEQLKEIGVVVGGAFGSCDDDDESE